MTERKTALIVSARAPGRKATQAGHRTCARNILDICQDHETDLFILCKEAEDLSDIDYFRSVCRKVRVRTISLPEAAINLVMHLGLPYQIALRQSQSIRRDLAAFVADRYDLVHFDYTETAIFADAIAAGSRQAFCYDVLTEIAQRRKQSARGEKQFWRLQETLSRRFERTYLSKMDRVFVHSATDGHDLEAMGVQAGRICVVAPQFYPIEPVNRDVERRPLRLLFWGAFSREENREAARFLRDQIMPLLPVAEFQGVLAGAESDRYFQATESVEVTGFVPDVAKVFSNADIGVFPLFHGSGLKVKILEALHAGLPVVTTPVGLEGFDCGENDGLFLAQTPEEFVVQIRRLTANTLRFKKAAQAAADWAKRYIQRSVFSVSSSNR